MSPQIIEQPVENTKYFQLTLTNYDHLPIRNKHTTAPTFKDFSTNRLAILHDLLEFEVFEDDIWIITYPKCGTTWAQEMTWLLMNNLNFEKAKSIDIELRSPFIELTKDHLKMCKHLSRPRLIKSHADIKFLPKQLWTKNPKIMFVVRDPRDAFVSLYHHNKFFFGKTVEESIESFIQDKLKYGNFWPMVLSFYAFRIRSNIIFFSYEEMKRNLEFVVLKVAKFIGRNYDKGPIRELLEHLDFNSMKNNVACSHRLDLEDVRKKKNIQKDDIDEDARFYRKGKVGSYQDELYEEILSKIDEWQKSFLDCEGIYLEDILWSNGHVEQS